MTDRPWPTEADPVVTIDLPDGDAVRTQARVVTVDLNGDGWEYRLAFPGIADSAAERLSRLVALGADGRRFGAPPFFLTERSGSSLGPSSERGSVEGGLSRYA